MLSTTRASLQFSYVGQAIGVWPSPCSFIAEIVLKAYNVPRGLSNLRVLVAAKVPGGEFVGKILTIGQPIEVDVGTSTNISVLLPELPWNFLEVLFIVEKHSISYSISRNTVIQYIVQKSSTIYFRNFETDPVGLADAGSELYEDPKRVFERVRRVPIFVVAILCHPRHYDTKTLRYLLLTPSKSHLGP